MGDGALIIPIGHSVGPRNTETSAGPARGHQVRVGTELLTLPAEQFAVWSLAHGAPERTHEGVRWTRDELGTALDGRPVADTVCALHKRGLLVEVAPETTEAVRFARAHRVVPLVFGLGDGPDGRSAVGLYHEPLLLLAPALAELWQFAAVSANLWAGCLAAAEGAAAAGQVAPEQIEPARVLCGVLRALHALLVTGVACVDVPLPVGAVR